MVNNTNYISMTDRVQVNSEDIVKMFDMLITITNVISHVIRILDNDNKITDELNNIIAEANENLKKLKGEN